MACFEAGMLKMPGEISCNGLILLGVMQKKRTMKKLFITLAMLISMIPISCKKSGGETTATLALIQHKWMLVSHNGEALRYVGTADDYYNFNINDTLYRYIDKNYDTLAYTLQGDNKTVAMYSITNGVKYPVPITYTINVLDAGHFVLGSFGLPIYILDSLKR